MSLSIGTGVHEPSLLENVICIEALSAGSYFYCLQ